MDEPLADPSCIALYFVDELAAKDIKVVLSGEGADEFFGGYNIYHEPLSLAGYQKLPLGLRKGLASIVKKLPNFKGKNFIIRAKIEAGVLRACHKRPISANDINKLIDEVETEIFSREEKEIPSDEIGEIVMDKIKDLDDVAYVRFASVYREFKDVNTFMSELKKMLDK